MSTPPIDRLNAALGGRYLVERELGSGGMATVYLARDLRHERSVALKVFRPELASAVGADRFLAEIRIAANLTHPNIAPLFESGEADGLLFYAMPHLTGESLRVLLDRERQLSLERALEIAGAVASALDYAHRQGVVHRDIKPENILMHEGQPVVLDFGIALAVREAAGDRLTQTGLSIGTPSYMSPEQAAGDRTVDARTDVYALGALLYEMVAGDRPFPGKNVQAVVARILTEEPTPLGRLRDGVPPYVERAVQRALAKVPADRFSTAAGFLEALREGAAAPSSVGAPRSWRTFAAVGLGVALVVVGVRWANPLGPEASDPLGGELTVRRLTSDVGIEMLAGPGPGGGQFVYVRVQNSSAELYIASRGGVARPLLETAYDETSPRWSPDGSQIAYLTDLGSGTVIHTIPPSGGQPRHVADVGIPMIERTTSGLFALGAQPWSPDGERLVFSRMDPTGSIGLWTVALESGEEVRISEPPAGFDDLAGAWSFDGERIVFARMTGGVGKLWTVPASGGEPTVLLDDGYSNTVPSWLPGDRGVAYSSFREGVLNVWGVDLESRATRRLTSGVAFHYVPVAEAGGRIFYTDFTHQIDLHLLDLANPEGEDRQLTSNIADNFGARVAADGRSMVYFSNRPDDYEIWRYDLETGTETPISRHPATDFLVDVSPGGDAIAFFSDRDGAYRVWTSDLDGGGATRVSDHLVHVPGSGPVDVHFGGPRWSPDGSLIGYVAATETALSLWVVEPDGSNLRSTPVAGVLTFDWYEDSDRVIYTRMAPSGLELRAAHLATGEDVLLLAGPAGEVTVSPEGSAVAIVYAHSHFTMDLHVLDLTPPASPGGLPGTSGEPRQVTFGNGAWHVHIGDWLPDGSGIVYSRDTDHGDVFVLEPVR